MPLSAPTYDAVKPRMIMKLQEGATMSDFMAWMGTQEGPPNAENAGYVGILTRPVNPTSCSG